MIADFHGNDHESRGDGKEDSHQWKDELFPLKKGTLPRPNASRSTPRRGVQSGDAIAELIGQDSRLRFNATICAIGRTMGITTKALPGSTLETQNKFSFECHINGEEMSFYVFRGEKR